MYYELCMTQREIAAELGLTQKIVWNIMRRHGLKARKAAKRDQWGSRNHSWKGLHASYQAFHMRVERRRGKPRYCEVCGTTDPNKHYDWANLTGRYHDPNDYARMCRSCHWRYDRRILNIHQMRERLGGVISHA